jgi:hypothetical protein
LGHMCHTGFRRSPPDTCNYSFPSTPIRRLRRHRSLRLRRSSYPRTAHPRARSHPHTDRTTARPTHGHICRCSFLPHRTQPHPSHRKLKGRRCTYPHSWDSLQSLSCSRRTADLGSPVGRCRRTGWCRGHDTRALCFDRCNSALSFHTDRQCSSDSRHSWAHKTHSEFRQTPTGSCSYNEGASRRPRERCRCSSH